MRRFLFLTTAIIFFFFMTVDTFAATYYVKPNGDDSRDGRSDATAWKTISKVNSYRFGKGDDVYFKSQGTWTGELLAVDWSGTAENRVTVGAYNGDGQIGVSGDKPIINGQNRIPAGQYVGLIDVTGSYVTIENIRLINSKGNGLAVKDTDHVNITNLKVDNIFMSGIRYKNTNYGTIQGNELSNVGLAGVEGAFRGGGWPANLSIIGSEYITIKKNTLYKSGGEGIGLFSKGSQDTKYCTVEENVVYANKMAEIAVINTSYNVVRYNLIYGTTDKTYWRGGKPSHGIYINDERGRADLRSRNNEVYGNLIANCGAGISIGTSAEVGSNFRESVIYNNTIVDCYDGFLLWGNNATDSQISNNIIWGISSGHNLYSGSATTPGINWSYNNWSSNPGSPASGNGDVIGNPSLRKTTGWRSFKGGDISASDFALQPNSPALNAGRTLNAKFMVIPECDTSDWLSKRIILFRQEDQGSGWEIGADIHIQNSTTIQPPQSLRILN